VVISDKALSYIISSGCQSGHIVYTFNVLHLPFQCCKNSSLYKL